MFVTLAAITLEFVASKTLVSIGQNYQSEFQAYEQAVDKPSGASFYTTFASPQQFQGDGLGFVSYINGDIVNGYGELGLSLKESGNCGYIYNYLAAIVNGQYDNQIDTLSSIIKQYNSIIWLVRIGYEVSQNLFANCCSGTNCDDSHYQNAFNYIAKRIRTTNSVSNVKFIYHPWRYWPDAKYLYPGDEYVDYIGWSVFNNDICLPISGGVNTCPNGINDRIDPNLKQSIDWAVSNTTKQLIISESSPQPPVTDNISQFNDYLGRVYNLIISLYPNRFFMWIYINENWPSHGWSSQYWGNSQVQANPSTLAYWKNVTTLLNK
eukprot:302656_1